MDGLSLKPEYLELIWLAHHPLTSRKILSSLRTKHKMLCKKTCWGWGPDACRPAPASTSSWVCPQRQCVHRLFAHVTSGSDDCEVAEKAEATRCDFDTVYDAASTLEALENITLICAPNECTASCIETLRRYVQTHRRYLQTGGTNTQEVRTDAQEV